MYKLLIVFLLLLPFSINAQLYKRYNSSTNWTNINFNYKTSEKEEFVSQISLRRPYNSKHLDPLKSYFPLNQYSFYHVLAGYQYQPSQHWLMHGSLRFREEVFDTKIVALRAFLSHIGIYKNLRFQKQVMYERMQILTSKDESHNRLRVMVGLTKSYKLFGKNMTGFFSYELFKRFPKSADNQPRFSTSRLRFELIYSFTNNFGIGLFAMRNTAFTYQTGTYDEFQNVITLKGRYNTITPIYGIQVYFRMKSEKMNQTTD